MFAETIPVDCPRCRRALYPAGRPRPKATDHWLTSLGIWIGAVASLGVFSAGLYLVRTRWHYRLPINATAMALCVPAMIPPALIGLAVARLPRTLKLRCAHCGWRQRFRVGGRRRRAMLSRSASGPTSAEVGSPRRVPLPPALPNVEADVSSADSVFSGEDPSAAGDASQASRLDAAGDADPFVIDDSDYDAAAWIEAAFIEGRSYQWIRARLTASGWEPSQADELVEQGRRATRHRRR